MRWRYIPRGVLLGLLCAAVAWSLSSPELAHGVDEWLFDGWFQVRGVRPTQAKIVLVGLDDASLDALHKPAAFLSPELAEVVACLKQQGAAAIGIDLIVPQSLEHSGDFDRFLGGERMGQAVLAADNVVLTKRLSGAALAGDSREAWLLPLTQWRFKSLVGQPAPTDLAFTDLDEDLDHFFRRQQLLLREGDLHFGLALHAVATRSQVRWQDGLWVGDQRVPLDGQQRLRVNFVGPPGSFPVVLFQDVLAAARSGRPLPVDVRGAVVIVGATSPSLQDYHATPYGNRFYHRLLSRQPGLMAGPELHGHIAATLADRAYIRSVPWPVALAILAGFGILLGYAFARLNLEWGVLLALAHHFGWLALSLAMFWMFRLQVEMVPMLLLGVLAYGATFGLRWRRLRRMLGIVKSEAVAQALEANAAPLELRGESRVVTVLFADVRGFTAFSDSHKPQEVVALLYAYFGAVVPVIEAHGGTLNTYMGDGIMVIFGAPAACPDHAPPAVQAALALVRRVHELGPRWAELGAPGLRVGVGIDTGEVVVGTVGSPRRLDYTAIGDAVNAAARIEGENKHLGSEILVSSRTWAALPAEEQGRLGGVPVGPVPLRGKAQPLELRRIEV
jgi:adenylate cyclase